MQLILFYAETYSQPVENLLIAANNYHGHDLLQVPVLVPCGHWLHCQSGCTAGRLTPCELWCRVVALHHIYEHM